MTTKRTTKSEKYTPNAGRNTDLPADFPLDLLGEFGTWDAVTLGNIGRVATMAMSGGGYFGLSVTDDGGSAKLAIRNTRLSFERRVYKLKDLQGLLSYCHTKLRDAPDIRPTSPGEVDAPVKP